MPRYFFHVHDSSEALDGNGTLLSGPAEARTQAVIAAAEMLKDFAPKFWAHPEWRMWVTNEAGEIVCRLVLKAESAPSEPR